MSDDSTTARLAALTRLRDLEWQMHVARTRELSHDLRNLIQITELTAATLKGKVPPPLDELVVEVDKVATAMKLELDTRKGPYAAVAARVRSVIDAVRTLVPELAVTYQLDEAATTVLTPVELDQVVLGLVVDAAHTATKLELLARARVIDQRRWIELVCSFDADAGELRNLTWIVERAGGEVSSSERRGGGTEVAVALPVPA